MDFEGMGLAIGYGRTLRAIEHEAARQIGIANATIVALEASVSRERGNRLALAAGRSAQIAALQEALQCVDPGNPALQPTGLQYTCGSAELVYEAVFGDAYDAVAMTHRVALSTRAKTPEQARQQRAVAALDAVLAEPIRITRKWFVRRILWRTEQHRTVAGAERARALAARQAYDEIT